MALAWRLSGLRGLVTALVSLALLAQVLFGAPLAARMMTAAPVCAAMGDPASDHAPSPLAPHSHDLCLVCHAAALPLALPTAALLLLVPCVQAWRAQRLRHVAIRTVSRFCRYRSRAPPALA